MTGLSDKRTQVIAALVSSDGSRLDQSCVGDRRTVRHYEGVSVENLTIKLRLQVQ
jgi:hypothetical protein